MRYSLIHTTWQENKSRLSLVRRMVFIEEQHVPEELEWDEFDDTAHHILVCDEADNPIATGRIKTDGHIGRMAVLKNYRNRGIGREVLSALTEEATNRKLQSVFLHAQVTAIPFYEKQGFEVTSEEFMDANIPHRTMAKSI